MRALRKAGATAASVFPSPVCISATLPTSSTRPARSCTRNGRKPSEDFYDGYVVNCIIDAAYRAAESKRWEPVETEDWRGRVDVEPICAQREYDDAHYLIKEERMPDGSAKLILKEKQTGKIVQRVTGADGG